jgi:hypothetical protein
MITREALRVLVNNLAFTSGVNRDYDSKFGVEGAKIGTTVNVRKPPRYVGRTGQAISIEDATETQVPVTLTTQRGVDITFTSQDLALSIDDFSKRFIKPAVANIANGVDADGLALYNTVFNAVGTPGTTPNAALTYLLAGAKLDDNATPVDDERSLVMTPTMQATIVDALKGLFQSSQDIAKQYRRGRMGTGLGFDFSMDQNCKTHTVGPLGGTPLVNGAAQTGATLATKGWTASAASRLKKGDVFTVAGVYAVNPQSKQQLTSLQQFVATADFSSDGSGNGSVAISPSITVTTGFQTVSATAADGAAITVLGAASTVTPQALAYHRDAFTLACADLPLPGGVDMAARISDKQTGLSIRMVRAYDITTDKWPCRLDILYGWASIYPELACRIAG